MFFYWENAMVSFMLCMSHCVALCRRDETKRSTLTLMKAMSLKNSVTGYDRLHTVVTSLGMEVSDPILTALRTEVAVCRREERERLAFVEPVLLGIEAVARHVDEIRVLADARALRLLNELVETYRRITVDGAEEEEAPALASEALHKVLAWQHSCILESLHRTTGSEQAGSLLNNELPAFAVKELIGAVRQEIAATGMMAIRESASLLELVHAADARKDGSGTNKDLSSVVRENISSLQQVLHQEMGRLRHDFIRE